MENKFDVIIYSANLSGVIASIILKNLGKKVLLLNRYGFFGGSITESLNLYQRKVISNGQSTLLVDNILERLLNDKSGILFEDENHILINPENFKFVLQKVAEENKIELLFHITPYRIESKNNDINITVIGKEGEIFLKCQKIIDLSSEFTFAPLIDKSSRKFHHSRINFISLPIEEKLIHKINYNFNRKIKLNDGRWWFSVDLESENIFDVEEVAHQTLDKLDETLRQNKSRIQVVPAQSHIIFSFARNENFGNNIFLLTDFVNSFNPEEEFITAQKIAMILNNEKYF